MRIIENKAVNLLKQGKSIRLLAGEKFGARKNDPDECLPILKEFMPEKDFQNLKIAEAPKEFEKALDKYETVQF